MGMEPILLKIIDLLKNIHKIESHFEIISGKPGPSYFFPARPAPAAGWRRGLDYDNYLIIILK
jgi:hypothetical protein